MSFVAAAVIGGAVAIYSANQARKSAQGVANAANNATGLQSQMYWQTREDQEPWRVAGGRSVDRLSVLLGLSGDTRTKDYGQLNQQFNYSQNTDPGTQFRFDQANKALERSAAAKGNLMSGGTLKALAGYNQDMASQEYGNAYNRWKSNQDTTYNRLAGLAGLGQTSTQATGQAGQNYANAAGQYGIGGAQAIASGNIAGANAIASGFNNGVNNWMQYQQLQEMQKQGMYNYLRGSTNGGHPTP